MEIEMVSKKTKFLDGRSEQPPNTYVVTLEGLDQEMYDLFDIVAGNSTLHEQAEIAKKICSNIAFKGEEQNV